LFFIYIYTQLLLYIVQAPRLIGGNATCITGPPAIDQYCVYLPKGRLLNREIWTNPPGAGLPNFQS